MQNPCKGNRQFAVNHGYACSLARGLLGQSHGLPKGFDMDEVGNYWGAGGVAHLLLESHADFDDA